MIVSLCAGSAKGKSVASHCASHEWTQTCFSCELVHTLGLVSLRAWELHSGTWPGTAPLEPSWLDH